MDFTSKTQRCFLNAGTEDKENMGSNNKGQKNRDIDEKLGKGSKSDQNPKKPKTRCKKKSSLAFSLEVTAEIIEFSLEEEVSQKHERTFFYDKLKDKYGLENKKSICNYIKFLKKLTVESRTKLLQDAEVD